MSNTFEDYYTHGIEFFKNGQFENAITELHKSIDLNSDASESYYYLGLSYKELGQFEQAIQEFQKTIKINPKDTECRKYLVLTYLELGDYETASRKLNKIFSSISDSDFFYECGSKIFKSGNDTLFSTSEDCLNRAIEINPKDFRPRFVLIELYDLLGENQAANDVLMNAWDFDPSNIPVIKKLAQQSFFNDPILERRCITELRKNLINNPNKIQACADFTFAMLAAYCEGGNKREDLLNETIKNIPEILDKLPKSDDKVLIQAYMDLAFTYGHLNQTDNVIITWENLLNFVSSTQLLPPDLFGDLEFRFEKQKKYGKLVRLYNWILNSEINEIHPMFLEEDTKNMYYLRLSQTYFKLKKYYFAKDALEKIPKKSRYSITAKEEFEKINHRIERIENLERKLDRFERELRLIIEIRCIKNKKDFLQDNLDEKITSEVKKQLRRELEDFPKSSDDDFNQYDCLDLSNCQTIIGSYWNVFAPVFKQKKSFNNRILRVIKFRNAVKHNRPIKDSIMGDCEGAVDWILDLMEKQ
jgi:tetratricopeptide (TPR) repeat protein